MMRWRITIGAMVSLALCACDESAAPVPEGEGRTAPAAETAAPARESERAASPVREAPPVTVGADTPAAPTAGCAFGEPRPVQAGAWSAIARGPRGFALAVSAHEEARESITVRRVSPDGTDRVIAQGALEHPVPIEHRRAGPALAAIDDRLALVLVDGQRRVLVAELAEDAIDAPLAWTVVGQNASHRFAPAVSAVGDAWAVAWTSERDEAMRVHGAIVRRGEVSAPRELVAPAGGSAAPAFVMGASAPTLLFVDPRQGLSVIHRVGVRADGFAEPAIARPVNLVTEPPALAAVRAGEHDFAAYTAIGSAATTAIGLVRLDETTPPVPVVSGTGYGVLHLAAASLPNGRAVLVADAPREPPPTAPRELHVRVLDARGSLGDAAIVRGPSGAAQRGRVAHHGEGLVAVSFTDGQQVHVAIGRCAAQ
jgi:hypothetical protein